MKTAIATDDNWSGARRSLYAIIRLLIENARRLR